MSERESIRAAILIFSHQLTQITFDGGRPRTDGGDDVEDFIARFEAILKGIKAITHSTYASPVKKTMMQAQLRDRAASWAWMTKDTEEMGYDGFKEELRRRFGNGKK